MKHSSQESPLIIPRTESLAQQAARCILAEIQSGVFLPGDMLPSENDLAKRYGISRTILREALASMKNNNIIEARQGKGTFVKNPENRQAFCLSGVFTTMSQTEVHFLYEMRAILEAEAASLAAVRQTEEDRQRTREGMDALHQAVENNKSGEEGHNLFNESIATASHNPVLIEFLSFLRAKLCFLSHELRINTMKSPERAILVLREHQCIADAILSGEPCSARKAVLNHLRNAARRAGFEIYAP